MSVYNADGFRYWTVAEQRLYIDGVILGVADDPPELDRTDPDRFVASFIARYAYRFDLLAIEILGVELDEWQEAVVLDFCAGERMISIRSSHGPGKTFLLALIAICFLLTRYRAKVVLTAPTGAQLYGGLYAEIISMLSHVPEEIQALFNITSDKIAMKSTPDMPGLDKEVFLEARTSSKEKPEALQGVHSDHVLIVIEEASGVDEKVFKASGGSMQGPHRQMLLAGNPTRLKGRFANSHRKRQYKDRFRKFHVGYKVNEDNPNWNAQSGKPALPWVGEDGTRHFSSPRIEQSFVDDIIADEGIESNEYLIRVKGDFGKTDGDAYISEELVEMAMHRDIAEAPSYVKPVWACDPARYGQDSTAFGKKRGQKIYGLKRRRGLDTMQVAGEIKNEWDETPESKRPTAILIDVIGIGAGVVDRLLEQNLPVIAVNVSETPVNPEAKCMRLRDEIYKRTKKWLQARGGSIENNEEAKEDLTSLHYTYSSDGRLKIESKEELRRRGMPSPDLGDVIAMLMLGDDYATYGAEAATPRNWGNPIKRGLRVTV